MRFLHLAVLSLSISLPTAHAALVRYTPTGTLDYHDGNENFVDDERVNLDVIAATATSAQVAERIREALVLPESTVRSVTEIFASESPPNRATLTVEDVMAISAFGGVVREVIARALLAHVDQPPNLINRLDMVDEIRRDPEASLRRFRIFRGVEFGYPRTTSRPGARVHLISGEPGPVGKTALVETLVRASGRRVVHLHPHREFSHFDIEALVTDLMRASGETQNPILVVETWERLSRTERRLLLNLFHHRELLGDTSVFVVGTRHGLPARTNEDQLASRLTAVADTVHVVRRPATVEAYAGIIGRWGWPRLDEGSRWTGRIALEAYEYQEAVQRSVLRDLNVVLDRKGDGCDQLFTHDSHEANRAFARLTSVVREFYEVTSR